MHIYLYLCTYSNKYNDFGTQEREQREPLAQLPSENYINNCNNIQSMNATASIATTAYVFPPPSMHMQQPVPVYKVSISPSLSLSLSRSVARSLSLSLPLSLPLSLSIIYRYGIQTVSVGV